MSVFKSELNWSTYQDTQLRVLESIGRSLSNTERRLDDSFNKLESILTFIGKASEVNAKNISSMTKEWTNSSVELNSSIGDIIRSNTKLSRSTDSAGEGLEELGRKSRKAGESLLSSVGTMIGRIYDHLGRLEGIGKNVDNFSEASNQMIKLSGMNGKVVKEFRSGIMSIVRDLNKTTGSLYSPQRSYEQVISISQGVTSNLEAMEEMARPLLLSYETLDVNMNTVAELFNRFYTRYSFNSMNMESTLDAIRGNTAGNSASAEDTLRVMNDLEVLMTSYAKGDTAKLEEAMNATSTFVSYLESMELSPDTFAKYMKDLYYGDFSDTSILTLLEKSGSGITGPEATKMLREDYANATEVLTDAFMNGMYNLRSVYDGSFSIRDISKNFGLDEDFVEKIYSLMSDGNYKSIYEFIEDQANKSPATMEELAEDKYVSAADKANHWLELIYEVVARIQEWNPLGFGLSDVALAASLTKGVLWGRGSSNMLRSAGSGLLTKAGYNMIGGRGTSELLALDGVSSTSASLVGAGSLLGVTAGLGMGAYGIYTGVNDIKNGDTRYGVANIAGAAAGIGGAGALTAGLLGAGAAAGPIGWALLAIGGITLLTTSIVKAANKIGSAEAVEQAYKEASKAISDSAADQEDALLQIKAGLEEGADLEKQRNALINSGILAESDIQKAREANIDGLKQLTDAYLKVSDQWSSEALGMMDDYAQKDIGYAKGFQSNLEYILQNLNDNDKLQAGTEEGEAVQALLFRLYRSLGERKDDLDGDTLKLYKAMSAVFESDRGGKYIDKEGNVTAKGFNKIIDAGSWNTAFLNAAFLPEELMSATSVMAVKNDYGSALSKKIQYGLGEYYGSDNAAYVADAVGKLYAYKDQGVGSIEDAEKILKDLYDKGLTSDKYPEIKQAADYWGIEGYAEGSNYINRDQVAILHEGEAVVPKRYNPAANLDELKKLTDAYLKAQSSKSEEEEKSFSSFLEELIEIRKFLKEWKDYSTKEKKLSEVRSRHSLSSAFITRYMNMT